MSQFQNPRVVLTFFITSPLSSLVIRQMQRTLTLIEMVSNELTTLLEWTWPVGK